MIRQFIASLIVIAAAAAAWVFLVPGSTATLASYGIVLPFAPAPTATPAEGQAQASPGGQRPGGGGTGGPGGRGFTRQTNVVTTPVTMATINTDLSAVGAKLFVSCGSGTTITSLTSGCLRIRFSTSFG